MTDPASLPSHEDFAGAADWWRDAGLEHGFADDATDWLAPPPVSDADMAAAAGASPPPVRPAAAAPVEIASPVRFGGDEAEWPQDLAGFAPWWLSNPAVELGGTGPRVAPRGRAQPALMVIVAHPEEEDRDTLLSGPEGRLLAGFLRAASIAPDQAYIASVLPRFTAAPDWSQINASGAADVLAHHVALAAPQRLLLLGDSIPPLLGHGTAQEGKSLRAFNHKGRDYPYVGAKGLARMLRSAAHRRDLWQSWLDGTDG